MKSSFLKRSGLILMGLFLLSLVSVHAQDQSKVFSADEIVAEKMEAIKEKLNLTDDQLEKVKAIDKQTEQKLEEAPDNTAARKVYQWRDGEYKKVFSVEQYKKYLKEKQAIVDEAQAAWMQKNGTPVPKK